jgi:ATP:ADP antiporter, AAA family
MSAALSALEDRKEHTTARLLIETLQERLGGTLERVFRLLGLRYPPKEMRAAYLAVNRKKSDEHTAALEFLDNVLEREMKRVILPLLDEGPRRAQAGREVFGIEAKDTRTALRELMRSGDSWLVACAIATAAELGAADLRPDIEPLSRSAGKEVGLVARSALATLSG